MSKDFNLQNLNQKENLSFPTARYFFLSEVYTYLLKCLIFVPDDLKSCACDI